MQTSYKREMDEGIPGEIYDLSDNRIDSYACEGGSVYPGMGVVGGTDVETQVKLPSATTSTIKGIALVQAKGVDANGDIVYNDGDTVPVLDTGRCWVEVTTAVAADEAAYLVFTGDDAGKFTNATNAGETASAITGAKFKKTTTAAGISVLELK